MTEELMVIAKNADEMAIAQERLVVWAGERLEEHRLHLIDYERNLHLAVEHKWRTSSLVSAVRITKAKVAYYEKLKAAFEAGYVVVPNMPIDVFAVRVDTASPSGGWRRHGRPVAEPSTATSPGEGRYVSKDVSVAARMIRERDWRGNDVEIAELRAWDFQQSDFPLKLAKPAVLDSVSMALAQKIFDEIGILPARPPQQLPQPGRLTVDPMVIGQIICKLSRYRERRVSFLITWWLAEEHLRV